MRAIRVLIATLAALTLVVPAATATTLTFNTAASPFTPGALNQGWWSDVLSNYDGNDNTFTGEIIDARQPSSGESRSFFTFDLSALDLTGYVIASATFETTRYMYDSADASETLGLFDVGTGAATLNHNTGTSAAIFDDLGTGTSYGSFVVDAYQSSNSQSLVFTLNASALQDIDAAAGGFFSIGGALLSIEQGADGNLVNDYSRDEALFSMSGQPGASSRLTLTLEPVQTLAPEPEAPTPVPEPMSLVFVGSGLVAMTRGRRRSR